MPRSFGDLTEFYAYYLEEHRHGACRALHLFGSVSVLGLLAHSIVTQDPSGLWFLPVAGYGPPWVGHFVFEKNRPATFSHPVYSFLSDWIMLKDIVTLRVPLWGELPPQSTS